MRKHQRYFPVLDQTGKLTQYFIIMRNGDKRFEDVVVDGNLQVIHARFADAEFFIREDKQKPLAEFVPKLAQLTFQKDLAPCWRKRAGCKPSLRASAANWTPRLRKRMSWNARRNCAKLTWPPRWSLK
jgi:glycyl-tRNA synthetase beta subunit